MNIKEQNKLVKNFVNKLIKRLKKAKHYKYLYEYTNNFFSIIKSAFVCFKEEFNNESNE